jgi:hypothetical protein
VSDRFDFFRLIFVFLGVIWPESCFGCEFSFLPLFLGPRVRLCSHTRSIERNSFSFSCFGSSVVPLPHNLFHTDLFWLTFSPKVQFGFAARLESSLQAITRGHFPTAPDSFYCRFGLFYIFLGQRAGPSLWFLVPGAPFTDFHRLLDCWFGS